MFSPIFFNHDLCPVSVTIFVHFCSHLDLFGPSVAALYDMECQQQLQRQEDRNSLFDRRCLNVRLTAKYERQRHCDFVFNRTTLFVYWWTGYRHRLYTAIFARSEGYLNVTCSIFAIAILSASTQRLYSRVDKKVKFY